MIYLAETVESCPSTSFIVVVESLPLKSTATTSCSKAISTPHPDKVSVRVLSKSARGTCHVQSHPSVYFLLKSKLQILSPRINRAPPLTSKFCALRASKSPTSSKCSMQRGKRLSPITNLGNLLFSTTFTFNPCLWR